VTSFLLTPYRSLVAFGTNYAGAQSAMVMACGVLNFDMSTAGRRAINLILTDVQRNFNGKIWEGNGPNIILWAIHILCGTRHVSTGRVTVCFIYIYIYIYIYRVFHDFRA
jgi:hypothetical protein